MVGKTPSERYRPGNVPDTPEALIPFLFDELYRISLALYDHVVGMVATQVGEIFPVTTVPTWHKLFAANTTVQSDTPGGAWQPDGSYIVPENGQYQMAVSSVIEPFGAGNKLYNVTLQINVAPEAGGAQSPLWRSVDGGDDNLELGASIAIGARLLAGNEVTFWLQSQHDQFVGDITVSSYLSITQSSAE